MTDTEQKRIEAICKVAHIDDISDLSDGYHTFKQLYYQRMMLFAALVKQNRGKAWKSLRHSDGELCFGGGWFVVGIDTPEGSYTYHYEDQYFNLFDCVELERGKPWDGHTEKDVTRLLSLEQEICSDSISRQWLMECVNEGWIKFDTEKDENRFIHLIRDVAPPVTLQPKSQPKYEDIAKAFQLGLAFGFGESHDEMDKVIDDIKKAITPQQKTGRWIFVDKAHEHAHCSECDYGDVDLMDGRPHNYCPNCGIKMIESEDEKE